MRKTEKQIEFAMDAIAKSHNAAPAKAAPKAKARNANAKTADNVCWEWRKQGSCVKGARCKFLHSNDDDENEQSTSQDPRTKTVCRYFMAGKCVRGNKCRYVRAQDNTTTTPAEDARPGVDGDSTNNDEAAATVNAKAKAKSKSVN